MASFIPAFQASAPSVLSRGGRVRFLAGDSGYERLRVSSYGADFTTGSLHHVTCSTSSRSRGSSSRRNSRSPNRNKNASAPAKPVSVLPGDMKLLRDLQDFISAADLPPHQVPSTRELARRGRQDLANAVRRRGEKALSQLLSNPNFDSATPKPPKPGSDTSYGASKPEVLPPHTTDLVPQHRTGLLVPHYEAAVEPTPQPRNFAHQNEPIEARTLDVAEVRGSDGEDDIELYTYEDDAESDKWARLRRIGSFQEPEESTAWQKAAVLRSKLTAFFEKPVESTLPRSNLVAVFDIIAKQQESERFLQRGEQEKDMLSSVRADPAAEIGRLSALLHAKEMENLRVSRELEETKAMLALVRAKQSAELAQSKQLAVEKDLRLHAAEQALHSLKLTQVDWWGEGNRVELAGSFNGWQHHAYLLPDLSSRASQLPGSRGPLLWRVELWLYPGVYEIKFIVDGRWVLDNRREIVQGHMGENNLLHVEP